MASVIKLTFHWLSSIEDVVEFHGQPAGWTNQHLLPAITLCWTPYLPTKLQLLPSSPITCSCHVNSIASTNQMRELLVQSYVFMCVCFVHVHVDIHFFSVLFLPIALIIQTGLEILHNPLSISCFVGINICCLFLFLLCL